MALTKLVTEGGDLTEAGKAAKAAKLTVIKGGQNDITETQVSEGVTVLTGPGVAEVSFANLPTAISRLVNLLKDAEDRKLAAARVVIAIERQELFRQANVETMGEFYPILLAQLEGVGWGAKRTVQAWVSFVKLFLDQLGVNEAQAMKANSHLHTMYVLANVDRKTGELKDAEEKPGKIDSHDFEAITNVITALVALPSVEQKKAGLDEDATEAMLASQVPASDLQTYKALVGQKPVLPLNGWTVKDTEDVVALLKKKPAEVKVRQVWYVSALDDEYARLERIAWEVETDKLDENEKPIWKEFDSAAKKGTEYPRARFDAMTKGDKVVNLNDEKDTEGEGFTSEKDDE